MVARPIFSGSASSLLARLRSLRVAAAIALLCHAATAVGAADGRLDEYQLKAGYLYNFAKFVTWPAEVFPTASTPFTICVFGEDPFGAMLDEVVRGRLIGNRSLSIRRPSHLQELGVCQILFVGAGTVSSFDAIRQRLGTTSVLTVGESEWFTRQGGMIRFGVKEERVGFDVNVAAAIRVRLEISSQLLKIASRFAQERGAQ